MKCVVLSIAAVLLFALHTSAETFTVTSAADPGDGVCDPSGVGDGCTLREAITAANSNSQPNRNRHDLIRISRAAGVHTIAPQALGLPSII